MKAFIHHIYMNTYHSRIYIYQIGSAKNSLAFE